MGCIAPGKDPNTLQEEPAARGNIPPSNQITQKAPTATDYNHHNPKTNHINNSIIETDVHVEVPNQDPLYINKSGRPGWNVNEVQQPNKGNNIPIQQSPVDVVYSSDAKEHVAGLNAARNSYQLYSNIHPISEVPSAFEADSKKYSQQANSMEVPKKQKQEFRRVVDQVTQKEQKANKQKLVELYNIREILSSGGGSLSSIPKSSMRYQGQEQILQAYNQNFSIPFLYLALTAQT